MTQLQSDTDSDTKTRLLEAGRVIFAEHGLDKAKVRDICAMAGTNVAAVNYHFGSKERLYMTVLSVNLRISKAKSPLDEGVTPESPPEARLRAFIHGVLHHFMDEDETSTKLGRLVLQEALEPSKYFKEIVEEHFRPSNLVLRDIIMDILPNAPRRVVARCVSSIMAQFISFRFHLHVRESLGPEFFIKDESFDEVAEGIFDFTLGGIHSLRSKYC